MGTVSMGRAATIAVVGAVVANLAIYFVAKSTLAISADFAPLMNPRPTVFFTVIGVGGAAGVYSMLRRRGAEASSTFTRVALLASFIPDAALLATGQPGATATSVGVLVAMHVIAAAIAIAVLTRVPGPSA